MQFVPAGGIKFFTIRNQKSFINLFNLFLRVCFSNYGQLFKVAHIPRVSTRGYSNLTPTGSFHMLMASHSYSITHSPNHLFFPIHAIKH